MSINTPHIQARQVGVMSWLSPSVTIRESHIVGKGLFAIEPIKKDAIVAIKGGHIVPREVFLALKSSCQIASLQIAEDMYVCPLVESEIPHVMNYINHSCDPNMGLRGQLFTVAMRDIEAGEELTADYCIAYTENEFEIDCICNAPHCRGRITSRDWQNPILRQKYKGYFCQYLADQINNIV